MDFLITALRIVGVLFVALMILNLMIVVHEWGHFLAARWRGLKVEAFQIWFGKPIWSRTVNGVQYGLGWLPMGGFVKLPQMSPMEAIEGDNACKGEELAPISPLDKIIVAFAGPLFSFMLAILPFSLIVWKVGRPVREASVPTQVAYIAPAQAAAKSDLKVGDIIRKIDGQPVVQWSGPVNSVTWGIVSSPNDNILFTVEREGKMLDIPIAAPRSAALAEKARAESKKGAVAGFIDRLLSRPPTRVVGIAPASRPVVYETAKNSPAQRAGLVKGDLITSIDGQPVTHTGVLFDRLETLQKEPAAQPITLTIERVGTPQTLTLTPEIPAKPKDHDKREIGLALGEDVQNLSYPTPWAQAKEAVLGMKNTFSAIFSRKSDVSVGQMSGTVKIVSIYMNLISGPHPFRQICWFSVVLNINLALLNLFPFPVFDGGHITMALLEWIRRKPLSIRVLELVSNAAVIFLLSYFAFITLKDVGDFRGQGEIEFAVPASH
jgi:regulator of sigma E protease